MKPEPKWPYKRPRGKIFKGFIDGDYECIMEPIPGYCPRCNTEFNKREDGSWTNCPNCGLIHRPRIFKNAKGDKT